MNSNELLQAPPLQVSQWLNTDQPLELTALRGKVIVLHAFQMLCPGCLNYGLPQARRVRQTFHSDVVVIGLHTVFEHHDVMTPRALEVFNHEYRWNFPIGIDQAAEPGQGGMPLTMRAYGLQGTPSLVLIDREGRVRVARLGQVDDLALGGLIGQLLAEALPQPS